MTVSDLPSKEKTVADGVTASFDFSFKVFSVSELEVYLDDVLQTLSTHYSVVLNTVTDGGTITFVSTPTNGQEVFRRRVMALNQGSAIPTEGNFPEETIENMVDKSRMIDQQLSEEIERCLQLPVTFTDAFINTFTPVASTLLGFNAANTAFQNYTTADLSALLLASANAGDIATHDGVDNLQFSELGALVAGKTTKTTPTVLDYLVIADQAAGNVAKKISLQQMMNVLGKLKGQILVGNGSNIVALTVGSNGQTLVADSAQSAGMRWGDLNFSNSFESAEQTITAAGSLTIAHGLGVKPKLIQCFLVCKTANLNYSVNDEVLINPHFNERNAAGTQGMALVSDATNINVRYGDQANIFALINKTTGAGADITAGSWRMVLRAYA